MGEKIVVILFDLDGTVIDSTEAILESFHNSFDVHKLAHPSDEEIKRLIGYPLDIMYKELGIEEALVWDIVDTYKLHYRKISREKTFLLEGAKESIILASKHAELGVVTTKTARYSKELLEHFGLMEYFKVLIGREDVQNPKPHAEPINKALESFTSRQDEVWMIGDTRMDIASAQNAGVNHVAVLSGYDNEKQLNELTTLIKKNVLEAVNYIINKQK